MIIGILIAGLLAVLSILLAAKELEEKAAFFGTIAKKLEPNKGDIAAGAIGFSILAIILTVVMIANPITMLIRLAACIMMVVIALPDGLPRFMKLINYENPAVIEEINNSMEKITAKSTTMAYIGLGLAVVVFLTLA